MHRAALAISILILSGGAANTAAAQWAADLPMLDCDGVPCVEAQIGTMPAGRTVIDTGDIVSIVDMTDSAASGFGHGNMKDGRVFKAAHAAASVGNAHLENVPIIAMALNDFIAKGQMPHSRAVLTYTAFKDRVLQLDFAHRRVRVSDVLTSPMPCASACAPLHLITFGKKGPPILVAEGFALHGKPITAQIDSVYTGGLLIYSASVETLGLSAAAKGTTRTERFAFTDGGVDMHKSVAQSITFGGKPLAANVPLYFPAPGVHQPDGLFDGTVGIALMKDSVVTLDLHDMTVSVDRS